MRIFETRTETNLPDLTTTLLKPEASNSTKKHLAEKLKILNPNTDFDTLTEGIALLVPDLSDINESAVTSFGNIVIEDLFSAVEDGLKSVVDRAELSIREIEIADKSFKEFLIDEEVKNLVRGNQKLKDQLAEVTSQRDVDRKTATAARNTLLTMQKDLTQELKSLTQLLK